MPAQPALRRRSIFFHSLQTFAVFPGAVVMAAGKTMRHAVCEKISPAIVTVEQMIQDEMKGKSDDQSQYRRFPVNQPQDHQGNGNPFPGVKKKKNIIEHLMFKHME